MKSTLDRRCRRPRLLNLRLPMLPSLAGYRFSEHAGHIALKLTRMPGGGREAKVGFESSIMELLRPYEHFTDSPLPALSGVAGGYLIGTWADRDAGATMAWRAGYRLPESLRTLETQLGQLLDQLTKSDFAPRVAALEKDADVALALLLDGLSRIRGGRCRQLVKPSGILSGGPHPSDAGAWT